MSPGLYQTLAEGNLRLKKLRKMQADTEASPLECDRARTDADNLQRDLVGVEKAISENLSLASRIQGLLNELHVSKHKTRDRSIVQTHLEEAQDRLRRELGPEPTA